MRLGLEQEKVKVKEKVNYLSQGALPSQDWSWAETQERGVRAGSPTCPAGNRA